MMLQAKCSSPTATGSPDSGDPMVAFRLVVRVVISQGGRGTAHVGGLRVVASVGVRLGVTAEVG